MVAIVRKLELHAPLQSPADRVVTIPTKMTAQPNRRSRRSSCLLAVLVAACAGCYSGEGLVARVHSDAIRLRLEEIELGRFRVTLPRDERTSEMTEIVVHLYCEVARYKITSVKEETERLRPQIEDVVIRTLREVSHEELAEPPLNSLRERLMTAINSVLTEAPLQSLGFYEVRFIRH